MQSFFLEDTKIVQVRKVMLGGWFGTNRRQLVQHIVKEIHSTFYSMEHMYWHITHTAVADPDLTLVWEWNSYIGRTVYYFLTGCFFFFFFFFMKRALHFATKLNYSVKRGSVGNILLLPRAKMLFVAMILFLWWWAKNVLFSVTITSFCIDNSIAARCTFTIS